MRNLIPVSIPCCSAVGCDNGAAKRAAAKKAEEAQHGTQPEPDKLGK